MSKLVVPNHCLRGFVGLQWLLERGWCSRGGGQVSDCCCCCVWRLALQDRQGFNNDDEESHVKTLGMDVMDMEVNIMTLDLKNSSGQIVNKQSSIGSKKVTSFQKEIKPEGTTWWTLRTCIGRCWKSLLS